MKEQQRTRVRARERLYAHAHAQPMWRRSKWKKRTTKTTIVTIAVRLGCALQISIKYTRCCNNIFDVFFFFPFDPFDFTVLHAVALGVKQLQIMQNKMNLWHNEVWSYFLHAFILLRWLTYDFCCFKDSYGLLILCAFNGSMVRFCNDYCRISHPCLHHIELYHDNLYTYLPQILPNCSYMLNDGIKWNGNT